MLESLERQGAVQWASTFDQSVLVSSTLVDRLASNFQGSIAEDTAPASDFHSLAGLQAAGSQRNNAAAGAFDVAAQTVEVDGACGGRAEGKGFIRPWLDDTGKLNQPFWSALTQRVTSVVMRNPGEMPSPYLFDPTTVLVFFDLSGSWWAQQARSGATQTSL